MININNYILEKLHIGKDSHNEVSLDSIVEEVETIFNTYPYKKISDVDYAIASEKWNADGYKSKHNKCFRITLSFDEDLDINKLNIIYHDLIDEVKKISGIQNVDTYWDQGLSYIRVDIVW